MSQQEIRLPPILQSIRQIQHRRQNSENVMQKWGEIDINSSEYLLKQMQEQQQSSNIMEQQQPVKKLRKKQSQFKILKTDGDDDYSENRFSLPNINSHNNSTIIGSNKEINEIYEDLNEGRMYKRRKPMSHSDIFLQKQLNQRKFSIDSQNNSQCSIENQQDFQRENKQLNRKSRARITLKVKKQLDTSIELQDSMVSTNDEQNNSVQSEYCIMNNSGKKSILKSSNELVFYSNKNIRKQEKQKSVFFQKKTIVINTNNGEQREDTLRIKPSSENKLQRSFYNSKLLKKSEKQN